METGDQRKTVRPSGSGMTVLPSDVEALARTVGLPLRVGRSEALAHALEADLRLFARLRDVPAGELHPAGSAPLRAEGGDDRR